MNYNVDFLIVSFAFLLLTVIFYLHQQRVPGIRSRIFTLLLLNGAVTLVLDVAAALTDKVASQIPLVVLYPINMLFLLCGQCSCALFLQYTIVITGVYGRMSKWMRAHIFLPLIVNTVLILLSPLSTSLIFYFDSSNTYHHGPLHLCLYLSAALYLLCGVTVVTIRRKKMRKEKFWAIILFVTITVAAMAIQSAHPTLLVNSVANALALTIMYHMLESPSFHIDPLTGLLNQSALSTLVTDFFEQEQRCTLLVFSLRKFETINHTVGMENGDLILKKFAFYLKTNYPGAYVLRSAGVSFTVVLLSDAPIDSAVLAAIQEELPKSFLPQQPEVLLHVKVAGINSEDCSDAADMLNMHDAFVGSRFRAGSGETILIGEQFRDECKHYSQMEHSLEYALNNDGVLVYYQPIHNSAGRLTALEALLRIRDPELGILPPQDIVILSEQNGMIHDLGKRVLEKTCSFLAEEHAENWKLDHVGVNLSAMQCARSDLVDSILKITQQYNVPHSLLAFEMTETAAVSLDNVHDNMMRLSTNGFSFLLDDFGTGYANFSRIADLPFHCIKLDKSILWSAMEDENQRTFFEEIVGILQHLGLSTLCEGVETPEQLSLLRKFGVEMMQGYYYSKPLSPEELLRYIQKERVTV